MGIGEKALAEAWISSADAARATTDDVEENPAVRELRERLSREYGDDYSIHARKKQMERILGR